MRKVILRMKEQEKYEKIKELVDHKGNYALTICIFITILSFGDWMTFFAN